MLSVNDVLAFNRNAHRSQIIKENLYYNDPELVQMYKDNIIPERAFIISSQNYADVMNACCELNDISSVIYKMLNNLKSCLEGKTPQDGLMMVNDVKQYLNISMQLNSNKFGHILN